MADKTSYETGEPIWTDIATPDLDATIAFYGSLFGWTAERGGEEFGGYSNFSLDGKHVAGAVPLMYDGQPPVWTCYLSTEDSDKTAAQVAEAGGTVHAPPMAVADLGTMTIFADPSGAFFGTWQSGTHLGTEVVGVDGSPGWAELSTRDKAKALPFYTSVFGLETKVDDDYTEFQVGGRSVAGCLDMPDTIPAEVPSFWMPYFLTQDPEAKAKEAASLGGSIMMPLMEMPGIRFSVVTDPHGSAFGLLHMTG